MSSSNADFSNCFISLNTKFRARHLTNIHFKNVGYYRQKKKDCVSFHLSNFIILKQDASEDLNCGAVKRFTLFAWSILPMVLTCLPGHVLI